MVEAEREEKEEKQTFRLSKNSIAGLVRDIIIIRERREWRDGKVQSKEESIEIMYQFEGRKDERFRYVVYDDDFKNVQDIHSYVKPPRDRKIDDRVASLIKEEIPIRSKMVLSYII